MDQEVELLSSVAKTLSTYTRLQSLCVGVLGLEAGDAKYGVNARNKALGMDHQALYSYQLRFDFQGEPTCLDYLNGRTFRVEEAPFLSVFYNLPKE